MNKRNSVVGIFLAGLTGALIVTGCATAAQPTPTSDNINTPHPAGIERPASFGIVPVTARGFSVYGSARVTANSKDVRAEIDCLDVEKIKPGYLATLINTQNEINASGKVTRLPDTSEDSDTCFIDLELENSSEESTPAEIPSTGEAETPGTVMKSSVSIRQSLPSVDSDVEVRIKLPVEDDLPYVDNHSLYTGKDGKTYVWFSEVEITKVTLEDMKLTEVVTGATDGRVTKILKGLPSKGSAIMGF